MSTNTKKNKHKCDPNAVCISVGPRYTCSCKTGYQLTDNLVCTNDNDFHEVGIVNSSLQSTLGPQLASNKKMIHDDATNSGLITLYVIIAIVAVLLLVGGACCVYYCMIKERRKDRATVAPRNGTDLPRSTCCCCGGFCVYYFLLKKRMKKNENNVPLTRKDTAVIDVSPRTDRMANNEPLYQ